MARVDPAHIQFGVGFQIAKGVGFVEHLLIGQARAFHPRQDIIAAAVHHAHDPGDVIGGQPFG